MQTRKKRHNRLTTLAEEEIPSGIPQTILEDLDSYNIINVEVDTVQNAEGLFLQERNETVDENNKQLGIAKLTIGNKPHRDRLYKEFTTASEKLNQALKELHEIESHPYNRFLKSVVKAAQDKLEDAERTLLHRESLYTEQVFGNIGAKQLAPAIESAKCLVELHLSHNLIKTPGLEHLSSFIANSKTLRTLDLNNNPFGPQGGRVLSESLKKNQSLESLALYSCVLQCDGCTAILESLFDHPHLVQLNLRNNKMLGFGAHSAAELLIKNKHVELLDISTNDIGVEGLAEVAKALRDNTTLQELKVKYNGINADLRLKENRELLLSLRKARVQGVWDL